MFPFLPPRPMRARPPRIPNPINHPVPKRLASQSPLN
ncbi:Uncharacterised protein [Chromobacterium violaceum]|uniref:Uncharacterized protein n=1 Tax=Chromobacterium violaceum TaxID=536 RepID=A0A447T5Q8_CHRVL|nr:Uncharacterised protein [Chromobacterium violaceum]